MKPILKKIFSIQGTELYQPIFSGVGIKTDIRKKFFDIEYVHQNSMEWDKGIGKIFINSNSLIQEYSLACSNMWIPQITYNFDRLLFEMQLQVLEWQTYVDGLTPSLKKLPYEIRQQMKRQRNLNRNYNTSIIKFLREKANQLDLPPLIN
jgi:hypothetical protein